MGLFYNNETAGSGVSKTQKKKPFFRFWQLFFNKFGAFFTINMIYVLFCIPIVTIGPATAAMTAMMRNIYLEKPQFLFHDFWILFKKNFKQSWFIGILDAAAIVGTYLLIASYPNIPEEDTTMRLMYAICIGAEVIFFMMNFYIYPQIAVLDLKLSQIVKNSFILVCANPLGEIIALAFYLGYGVLVACFPLVMLVLAPFLPLAWLCFISFFCCYPAVRKYLIDPYYAKTGEPNPEDPYSGSEGALFKDSGGNDRPLTRNKEDRKRSKGKKVIK